MRRYRLAACAVLAILSFTVVAACQSGSSGAPAPAPRASVPATPSGSDPVVASAGGSFCRQFAKTQADLVAAAQSGTLSTSDGEAEVHQTLNVAPGDILKAATVILNAQYDILAKDPAGEQERLSPEYLQSEKDYLAWSKTNC